MEEQVQWVLTYVQGGSADVWKENIMEELESGEVEYESVEEFLTCLKKRVWRRRGGVSEGGGVEKDGAGRKNNVGICSGVLRGRREEVVMKEDRW